LNFFPIQCLKEFSLIVSVGRCKYRLSEHSIGFILQATLLGVTADFRPQQISDRVFKFVVASRNVGFHIYNLRSFSCEQYKIYFNLWSNGGPNWVSEVEKFFKEEECQWSLVSHRKAKNSRSYAEVVSKEPLHTGANWVPLGTSRARRNWKPPHRTSVFQRISWPKKRYVDHRHWLAQAKNMDLQESGESAK
jgi:hypothetical protein